MFKENLINNKIYQPSDIEAMIQDSFEPKMYKKRQADKTYIEYYNIIGGFDIETSSFISNDGDKVALMYEWTFGINGLIMIGRTWEEFIAVVDTVSEKLGLGATRHIIIGVHNLGYEFQFIRKLFKWSKVFASDIRKPIYAITDSGIEFRDTYILSGFSLETVGKKLTEYQIEKLVGNLEYSKLRTPETPLTEKEIAYCVNDVKVVMAYLEECKEKDGKGNITRIPLTNTGRVRRFVKDNCFKGSKFQRYNYLSLMNGLTLKPQEYQDLKRAFQGGFTHANPFYVGDICKDVTSMDLTSSYPTQLCLPIFPVSKGESYNLKSMDDFNESLKYYCCLFELEIEGLESQFIYDSYISRSRCLICENATLSNGRVVRADKIRIIITEKDYAIIKKCYTWESCKVGHFRRYERGYLPKEIVLSVLELYKSKTQLKGLRGLNDDGVSYEELYMSRKGMLNSCYGMMVTDIVKDEITYTDDWEDTKPLLNASIDKYNKSKSRFLFYPWGVWCTAGARTSLWSGIFHLKEDYIYSDTDSVKFLNAERHESFFKAYNDKIQGMLKSTCKHFGIPEDYIRPKNSKGIEKPLGIWDFDGSYSKFKTLGAKRYMVEYADTEKVSMTVSGLNKKITVPYLIQKYGKEIFNKFDNSLYIPEGYTGKNIHTYIDEEKEGKCIDYLGNTYSYYAPSGVHLSESDYSLSLSEDFLNFILSVKEEFY